MKKKTFNSHKKNVYTSTGMMINHDSYKHTNRNNFFIKILWESICNMKLQSLSTLGVLVVNVYSFTVKNK